MIVRQRYPFEKNTIFIFYELEFTSQTNPAIKIISSSASTPKVKLLRKRLSFDKASGYARI